MSRLTSPLFGLDYTSAINPTYLHAAGVRAVVRYLSRYTSKVVTRQEATDLAAAGIGLALVFEDGARNAWAGYAQGESDARFAFAQARDILGDIPPGAKITFAVDDDPLGHPEHTDSYFDGVASVAGKARTGPYGNFDIVRHHADRGFGALFQTYAWSAGRLDTRAQIHQYSNDHVVGGHGVDFDHFYYADFGQWTHRPAPPPPPNPLLLYPTTKVHLQRGGKTYVLSERDVMARTLGALEQSRKYRTYLKGTLRFDCGLLRNNIHDWAYIHDPLPNGKPNWAKSNRGARWRGFNDCMKRIDRL